MRRRWHDWVIALGIVALAVTGVWTIWGADLARLFRGSAAPAETVADTPPPVTPPPGQAQGPF
jgi:hypothetical protein